MTIGFKEMYPTIIAKLIEVETAITEHYKKVVIANNTAVCKKTYCPYHISQLILELDNLILSADNSPYARKSESEWGGKVNVVENAADHNNS